MKIVLSSDALPDGDMGALVFACGRRALGGLELTIGLGHAHGLDGADLTMDEKPRGVADGVSIPVLWLRYPDAVENDVAAHLNAIAMSGVGALVDRAVEHLPHERVCLVHDSDPTRATAAAEWARSRGAGTCWEVSRERADGELMDEILAITGSTLRHVRLLGSGPEADPLDAGSGTGSMLSRLALAGYAGTIALAPGDPHRLADWERWLMKTRGWGCSTAAEKQARAQERRLQQTESQ